MLESCCDYPVYYPPEAVSKHAKKELVFLYSAVDGSVGQPFVALVVGELILLDDLAKLVNDVLLLDVHWSH